MTVHAEGQHLKTAKPRPKRRPKPVQIVRHLIQLAAFLAAPGLFVSVFAALKDIWVSAAQGNFSLAAQASSIALLLAVLPLTALWGRFFCGYLCAFGAAGDVLLWAGRRLHLPHITPKGKAEQALRLIKYVLLALICILVWTLGFALPDAWNPWSVFGRAASLSAWTDPAFLFTAGGALLLAIAVLSLFIDRAFCRYLCPLGAVFALISKIRLFHIRKADTHCGRCHICTDACIMGIDTSGSGMVTSSECIDCFRCADACPRANLMAPAREAVSATAAPLALAGMVYVGTIAAEKIAPGTAAEAAVTSTVSAASQGLYQDGTYTGSGQGYKGTTSVSVTVENGAISSVEVLSYADDAQFFQKASSTVIAEILSQQTAEVDAVSGATFSSEGIMAAVQDALESGAIASDSGGTAAQSTQESTSEGTESTAAAGAFAEVADGTYTGSGTGLRGTTTVSVTVEDGKVTSITAVSYEDDAPYFTRALSGMAEEIVSAQSLDVDTVSGATFSSNSILEAVADATGLDFTNPNSTLSSGHGGKRG
ncbi:MAG: FMN-binding protein [Atopobiaceae bacterium]